MRISRLFSSYHENVRNGGDRAIYVQISDIIEHSITLFDIANPFARKSNLKASVRQIMYQHIFLFLLYTNSNKKNSV